MWCQWDITSSWYCYSILFFLFLFFKEAMSRQVLSFALKNLYNIWIWFLGHPHLGKEKGHKNPPKLVHRVLWEKDILKTVGCHWRHIFIYNITFHNPKTQECLHLETSEWNGVWDPLRFFSWTVQCTGSESVWEHPCVSIRMCSWYE